MINNPGSTTANISPMKIQMATNGVADIEKESKKSKYLFTTIKYNLTTSIISYFDLISSRINVLTFLRKTNLMFSHKLSYNRRCDTRPDSGILIDRRNP